jgi:iron complex outermembrane receptor protein
MTNLRNVLLSLGAAVPFLTSSITLRAEDNTNTQPVRLPPVTIYGGGYRVLPGAASTTIVDTEPVQGGALASTRDLTALTPNLAVFDGNNDRMPRFSVRGLRENNFTTGDPAVGLYLDDVPFSDLYSRSIALHDVESIEFIKGPQGTLYGASGPGGVINVVSRQPGDAWHGSAGVTYGNYDQQAYDAAISGPVISNQLAIGVSGVYSSRDGFVRNVGRKTNPDTKETLAGRVQLRFTPTEDWEFTLIGAGQKFNDGFVPTFSPATGDRNYFRVARNYDGFVDTDTWNVALKAAYTASSFKITSISSYRNWRQNLAQDFDFSASPANSTIGLFKPQLDQCTEELRVRSLDDSAAFKWNGGLYFADNQVRTSSGRTIDIFPPMFVDRSITKSDVQGQTYAAFGEVTYTVADKLDFTAGVAAAWT